MQQRFYEWEDCYGVSVGDSFAESCSYIPWDFTHLWKVFTKYNLSLIL